WLFFQNADNSIQQITVVDGTFITGMFASSKVIVPASQAMPGTPIAVFTINDNSLEEIHVYFISSNSIINEYFYKSSIGGWSGGPGCMTCIDVLRLGVEPGSKALYAMGNS
ncbi:hypothetical protein B0H13DRAFT_1516343, partial [Mycena leptocephala]